MMWFIRELLNDVRQSAKWADYVGMAAMSVLGVFAALDNDWFELVAWFWALQSLVLICAYRALCDRANASTRELLKHLDAFLKTEAAE